jgi:hypothetical protein
MTSRLDAARYAVCAHQRGLKIPCEDCPPGSRNCPKCEWLIPFGDDFCTRCYENAVLSKETR